MQRNDQKVVNYYWRVAEAAAKRQMIVNFHGSYLPTGLRRTFPNVLTREGVRGLEQNKWSTTQTVHQDVMLPFIRMVAGPMDYTPGAMTNVHPNDFWPRFERPMSQGTRSHQVAMYVIYESPLQMLADSPSQYRREAETTRFISQIPTVWDDTMVLAGKVGEYVVIARKSHHDWFVAAMTGHSSREVEIDLSFLDPSQRYQAEIFADGTNAERFAEDYKIQKLDLVQASQKLKLELAKGGGAVVRFKMESNH